MYYLDFHGLYRPTKLEDRIAVRLDIDRDDAMAFRLKHQRGVCFYCAEPIDMKTGELDHLIPVYYGGDNKRRNLVASCKPCNRTKSTDQIEITNTRTISDYLNLIRHYEKFKNDKYNYKKRKYVLYKIYRADLFKHV